MKLLKDLAHAFIFAFAVGLGLYLASTLIGILLLW